MRTAVIVSLMLAVVLPAGAQQKLGDVAGSIKLKKTEGEPVVIDDAGMARASAPSPGGELSQELLDLTTDALQVATDIASYISGMPAIEPLTYDDSAGERLAAADFELEIASNSFPLFDDLVEYQAATEKAELGVAQVREGIAAAQTAVSRQRAVAREVREQTASGARVLGAALESMQSVGRSTAREETPPPIDPVAADAAIRAECGRRHAADSDAYNQCFDEQRAAVDRVLLRSGAGLEEATFNRIRNECRLEWPGDYVARDRCEQRRLTSASGR